MFPSTSSRETLRFSGNKLHGCSPRDQSLSDLLYSKTKQKQNLKTALRFQLSRATAVNISRVTVNCFPFNVIVFAMLPAHGIWRETVSLLDMSCHHELANEWARCSGKNASYITNQFVTVTNDCRSSVWELSCSALTHFLLILLPFGIILYH